jgi:hypothetical protein
MKKLYTDYILILIIGIFSTIRLNSAEKFEKYINSNWGTEFSFTVPPALIETGNVNTNFVRVFINSDVTTKATLKITGKGYSNTVTVSPGTATEISLEPTLAQPYIKTGLDPIFPSDVYLKSSINITSDAPVTVYVLVSYSSTSEGFTLIPVNLLANEYIISSYGDASIYYPPYTGFPSLCGITAVFDGTEVFFKLGGNNSTTTSSGQKSGDIVKKILNRGDVWMISTKGRDADLSGSVITSSLPVSVVSASYSANVPTINKYAGYIAEMEIPTKYWGKTYHIPVITGRKYSPVLRIYAKEPGTDININGSYDTTISQQGGVFGQGYIELRINDIDGAKCGTISSDKPISVTMYNTGVEEDGLPEPPGDPFQILLNPVENYLDEVSFSVPSVSTNSSFQNNYLSIIYYQDAFGNIPDDLMIGKFSGNIPNYLPAKSFNLIQNQVVDAANNVGLITVKIDPTGNYSVKSNSKFTAYLYGFNRESAYGFSAGLKVGFSENTDKTAPSVSWEMDCIGNVTGNVHDLPDDNTRSNLAGSLFLNDESSNFLKGNFETIIPGSTATAKFALKVSDINIDANAVIVFWDAAGNFTKSEIIYRAVNNQINSKYENYGSFKQNSSEIVKDFIITNNSDTNSIIEKISLKNGKNGFEVVNSNKMPFLLAKGKSLTFTVKFNPANSGVFSDSLGFGDECLFRYMTYLEAVVGNPVIEVSDVSFGDLTIGAELSSKSTIRNTGVSELKIKSFKKTISSDFEVVFDDVFDDTNPLILPAGADYSFNVKFTPKSVTSYLDSVVIISDASTADNVCVINARSIEPGLVAGSYTWGRKRIFRSNFPAGPYSIENENQSITLQNTGNTEILIKGIEVENEVNSDAFEFNRQIFNNLKLKAGEKYNFKVQFRPTQLGYHHLSIKYKTDFVGTATVTELSGFGSVPKLQSQIIEFDTTIVEDFDSPSIKKIEIKNLDGENWEFFDTLYIYDFNVLKIDEISEVWSNYGTKGFKIDKQVISFPIKLAPGKSYILHSGFVAVSEGINNSEFNIISDAIDTAKILLKGFGIEQQVTFIGGSAESCIGNEQIINGLIKNNSPQEIKFSEIVFDKYKPEFKLLNPEIAAGFTLAPSEQKSIDIVYKPEDLTEKQVELVVTDSRNTKLRKYATFSGKPLQYVTSIFNSPTQLTVNISDTIIQKISFKSNYNLKGIGLKELDVFVRFNGSMLKYIEESAQISNQLNGSFSITQDELIKDKGFLKFKIKSLSGIEISEDKELFEISFKAYFPNDLLNFSDIDVSILPVDNLCVVVQGSKSRVNINPVCGNDLRVIDVSNSKYKLSNISPNPVNSKIAKIEFSIGISAFTDLTIFNSQGMMIANPVNSYLEKGSYENLLNLENYSSGLYFYILKSGPYHEVRKFIIEK